MNSRDHIREFNASRRLGVSRVDVLVAFFIVAGLGMLCLPAVLKLRERARAAKCIDNLRNLNAGLHQYHDTFRTFPAAGVWNPGSSVSLDLQASRAVDRINHGNWAVMILPYLGQAELSQAYDSASSIGSAVNQPLREASLSVMNCPLDSFNRTDNRYRHTSFSGMQRAVEFARGNYAINGGTHTFDTNPPSTTSPRGDFGKVQYQQSPKSFSMWGNGIAGINKSFSMDDFANGTSTLVALEEVRAGLSEIDSRGVWSLGIIGASITWGHGIGSDDFAPNHQWVRGDDIMRCGELHQTLGAERIARERMPCCDYLDVNQQATSRSLHPDGVHVSLVDGSVRFISDKIAPALWHVMHSRETPGAILKDVDFDVNARPESEQTQQEQVTVHKASVADLADELTNSLGMSFRRIPAGDFVMGLPDQGNDQNPPAEVPAHPVTISRPYLMGVYEVTTGQFATVMGTEPVEDQGLSGIDEAKHLPAVNMTWEQAVEFCRKLSQMPEEAAAGRRYRLPTEAEWEYACRGGEKSAYVWKRARDSEDISGEAAGIHPALPITRIGTYSPNAFGLYDLRGNVWEWCADWFERDYYLRSPPIDPPGPDSGYIKVVRGGDWRFIGEHCFIDYPHLPPWKSNPLVGFRVVCELSSLPARGK